MYCLIFSSIERSTVFWIKLHDLGSEPGMLLLKIAFGTGAVPNKLLWNGACCRHHATIYLSFHKFEAFFGKILPVTSNINFIYLLS